MNKYYRRELESPPEGLLFAAVMVTDEELIPEVNTLFEEKFSAIEKRSHEYEFVHSTYYSREMGDKLIKYFVSFKELIDKQKLPDVKMQTMKMEEIFFYLKDGIHCRKVNIDPGYMTHSKVILATSKNYSHRVYLGKGVFAELTYLISKHGWKTLDWTYPDYKDSKVIYLFEELRKDYLVKQRKADSIQN